MGELTDPAARRRVIGWACERFAADALQQSSALARPVAAPVTNDSDLALENLTDIFAVDTLPSVEDDGLSVDVEAPVAAVFVEASNQPLETVLKSFAADFQRFANEWNGAAA